MLTITVARDGRTWYGRKLYRVTLNGKVGSIACTGLTRSRAIDLLRKIGHKLVSEGWSARTARTPT